MTIEHNLLANDLTKSHGAIWQTVANSVALAALTIAAIDVSQVKIVKQADTNQLWYATATTPTFREILTGTQALGVCQSDGTALSFSTLDLTSTKVANGPANTFLAGTGAGNQWLPVFSAPANPGDNGKIVRALNGNFTYIAGASQGQPLIWNAAGTQWEGGSDFGANTLTTTDGFVGNSGTSYLRLGLSSGSGSGVASAASAGNIRGARGTNGFTFNIRNNGDTADIAVMASDTVGATFTIGTVSAGGFTPIIAAPSAGSITLRVGSSATQMSLTTATVSLNQASLTLFGDANQSIIRSITTNATAFTTSFIGQTSSAVGGTGGPVLITGGTTSGASGTRTGGYVAVTSGAGQSQGGDLRLVFGTGASAATIGNLSFGGTAANTAWNSMAGGQFWADRGAAPTGNPTAGFYMWSETGGLPSWRNAAGDILIWTMTTAATASAGASGAPPAQVAEYMTINYKGNVRKIPLYAN